MFKYILLCSLLVHSIWAKPLEYQNHAEVAPHVVIVTPQAQLSLESLVHGTPIIHHTPFVRFIGPHEESIVYVPASAIHHNEVISRSFDGTKGKQINPQDFPSTVGALVASGAQGLQNAAQQAGGYISSASQYVPGNGGIQNAIEGIYQGLGSYLQGQSQQQQQQQQLQQQKIQQFEQKLQPQKQAQLIAIETPLISAGLSLPASISAPKLAVETPIISAGVALPSSELLNVVTGSVGSVGSLIPNLLKQKSLAVYGNEPGHHYFVEQPHHHVIEYIPGSLVLSPVPVTTTTVKARRSVLAEDNNEKEYLKEAVADIKPTEEDEKPVAAAAVDSAAAPSAESLIAAPENTAAVRSVKADDSEEKKESKDFVEEENKPAEVEKESTPSADAANQETLERQRRWANKAQQPEVERKTNYEKNRKPVLSKEALEIELAGY